MQCAGVVHGDIRCSNMRVFANSAQEALHVVLFDFSNSAPKFNHRGELAYGRDAGRFVAQFTNTYLTEWLMHSCI